MLYNNNQSEATKQARHCIEADKQAIATLESAYLAIREYRKNYAYSGRMIEAINLIGDELADISDDPNYAFPTVK